MEPEPAAFVTLATLPRDRENRRMRSVVGFALLAATALGCAHVEASRYFASGTAALDRGDPARAVHDLEQAAARTPDVSAIHNHLGIAYEQAGRSDDALRAYQRAVDLDCDNTAAEQNLDALRARTATASGR
jgi:Flp pilus assembly protein TadD